MSKPFSIEREPDWTMRESLASATATEPAPVPVWSFLSDFEAMAGDRSEPDAQFFVDSWTLGVDAAMRNLARRGKSGVLRSPGSSRAASSAGFLEENAFYTEFSAEARGHRLCDSASQPVQEELRSFDYEPAPCGPMNLARARRILGVDPGSSRAEVKNAYRRLAAQWHPDRLIGSNSEAHLQATEQMTIINEAYRLVRDRIS